MCPRVPSVSIVIPALYPQNVLPWRCPKEAVTLWETGTCVPMEGAIPEARAGEAPRNAQAMEHTWKVSPERDLFPNLCRSDLPQTRPRAGGTCAGRTLPAAPSHTPRAFQGNPSENIPKELSRTTGGVRPKAGLPKPELAEFLILQL